MFNVEAFLSTLPIMAYGMAGIFVVILLIYGSILLMGKLFRKT